MDESVMEFLFGALPNKWIQEVDVELREAAVAETKKDAWKPLDDARLYSDSCTSTRRTRLLTLTLNPNTEPYPVSPNLHLTSRLTPIPYLNPTRTLSLRT